MRWWAIALPIVVFLIILALSESRTPHSHTEAKISVEIDQLIQAMHGYKQTRLAVPPCMAEENLETRKTRFMQHLATAWPAQHYGKDAAAFDQLRDRVRDEWKYNYRDVSDRIAPLDLERLDAAEAIVFWLGGFPIPLDTDKMQPLANRKLFGFHRDEDDPFKRSLKFEKPQPLQYRTDPLYAFDEMRLIDQDRDGWPEYAAYHRPPDEPLPPFAYFESGAYAPTMKDRQLLGTCLYPHDPQTAERWGTAVPYLMNFDAADPSRSTWAYESGVQIICSGLDRRYGPRGSGNQMPTARVTAIKPRLQSYTAADRFQQPHNVDEAELDNLTNLHYQSLGQMP